jgi:hypothetical protein
VLGPAVDGCAGSRGRCLTEENYVCYVAAYCTFYCHYHHIIIVIIRLLFKDWGGDDFHPRFYVMSGGVQDFVLLVWNF